MALAIRSSKYSQTATTAATIILILHPTGATLLLILIQIRQAAALAQAQVLRQEAAEAVVVAVAQADPAEVVKNLYHEAGKRSKHFECFLLHIT